MSEWLQKVRFRWYVMQMRDRNACGYCSTQRPVERGAEWTCSDECEAELVRREASPF